MLASACPKSSVMWTPQMDPSRMFWGLATGWSHNNSVRWGVPLFFLYRWQRPAKVTLLVCGAPGLRPQMAIMWHRTMCSVAFYFLVCLWKSSQRPGAHVPPLWTGSDGCHLSGACLWPPTPHIVNNNVNEATLKQSGHCSTCLMPQIFVMVKDGKIPLDSA